MECTARAKANTTGTTIFSISKTGVKPSSLDIFQVLSTGEFGEGKRNGEQRKYKRAPSQKKQYINNFWIRIVERNAGFPNKPLSAYFYTIKGDLKFTRGSLTNVPCSSIFYVSLSEAEIIDSISYVSHQELQDFVYIHIYIYIYMYIYIYTYIYT